MNAKHAKNCEELRRRFEGREAIYVEHGALRVRVSNIRPKGGFHIGAEAEELVTPGLGVGMFHRVRPRRPGPLRWRFGGGYLTTFSTQSWRAGYGGWALYFAPEIIRDVVRFAPGLPTAADPNRAYQQVGGLLHRPGTREPEQFVFPDAVEEGSNELCRSDSPPVSVQVLSGWILCPWCDMRFMVSDPRRWDGEQHTTCGQRIVVRPAPPGPE
jgi:hypothetical protein